MSQCEQPAMEDQRSDHGSESGGPPTLPLLSATLVDSRSTSAMEELASLMLEMDIEEKGEPSFTIAAGKRIAPETEYQHSQVEAIVSNGREQETEPLVPQISKELLEHLVDCFVCHFNGFHQFLDGKDVEDLKMCGVEVNTIDCHFRNAALLAVAARFSTREDARQAGTAYSILAQGLPFHCIKHRPSDLVIQGLALLAWQELAFGVPSMAYNYICMITVYSHENKCAN
jgi:hypothetical protein